AADRVVPVAGVDDVVPVVARDLIGTAAAGDHIVGVAAGNTGRHPVARMHLGQVDGVDTRAAHDNDLVYARERVGLGNRLGDVDLVGPDGHDPWTERLGVDLLVRVACVALDAPRRVRPDIQGEGAALLAGQNARPFERNLEFEQFNASELEADFKEQGLDVGAEEELDVSADVEHGQRIPVVGNDVG